MKKFVNICTIGIIGILVFSCSVGMAQTKEKPKPIRTLVLLDEWFGDAYYLLKNEVASRGWTMTRIGVNAEYRGCYKKTRDTILKSDVLIPDFNNFSDYDCLIIPSGPQFRKFLENPAVLKFVTDAHNAGLLIASFCTGNFVIKAAGLYEPTDESALFPSKVTMVKNGILMGPRGGGPAPGDGYESAPIKEICDAIASHLERAGTFIDPRDSQTYKWAKIGNQIWMAENLRFKTDSGSWCWDNNEENCRIRGRLYNWNTAMKAAPPGWHIPSDQEWKELEMTLGLTKEQADQEGFRVDPDSLLAGKIKLIGNWPDKYEGNPIKITNESGFSAIKTGFYASKAYVNSIEEFTHSAYTAWWSSDGDNESAWIRCIGFFDNTIDRVKNKKVIAFPVRCVKDTETE
jgi:uncharacterized protein (TIGR02145 family)